MAAPVVAASAVLMHQALDARNAAANQAAILAQFTDDGAEFREQRVNNMVLH